MNKVFKSITLGCVLLVVAGCESRTDKTDSGGVTLSITDFDGLPLAVSVTTALAPCTTDDAPACGGFVQIGEITISNVLKDPSQSSSDLQNVEVTSYEVVYSRADSGEGVPGTYMQGVPGVVPVNGELTLMNFPFMGRSQLTNFPLQDLMLLGEDPETGNDIIPLTMEIRFFGRTLSGDAVESQTAFWTVEFLP